MKFELNKYYQHKMGRTIAILGILSTHAWGDQFIIEETDPTGQGISSVSPNEDHVDWVEVSKSDWNAAMNKDHSCCSCGLKIAREKEYRFIPSRGLIHEDCYQSIIKENA